MSDLFDSKKQRYKTTDLNINEMLEELSSFDIDTKKIENNSKEDNKIEEITEKERKKISQVEREIPENKKESPVKKEKNTVVLTPEPEEFNLKFDKELDDNFVISRNIGMMGKPNLPEPPGVPEIPYFPTMADIENFIDGKIPKVPEHFTIEVPPEFEEIVPPEPLGEPPPPPV